MPTHIYAVAVAVDESSGNNNGTFINGVRVEEHVLRDGDVIGFGKGRSVPLGQTIADKNLEVCMPAGCLILRCARRQAA
jgi:pSer/pThr/pTyr-binding forkhead associated (FHA) protein